MILLINTMLYFNKKIGFTIMKMFAIDTYTHDIKMFYKLIYMGMEGLEPSRL